MTRVLESTVERRLVDAVRRRGWMAVKQGGAGIRGIPDRLIIMPGRVAWVEVKRPGGRPRTDQTIMMRRLTRLGQTVRVWDGTGDVDMFLDSLTHGPDDLIPGKDKP